MNIVSYDFDGVGICLHRTFFDSESEAREWLEFDPCDQDRDEGEIMSNDYPDQHGEWQQWRDRWVARGGDSS